MHIYVQSVFSLTHPEEKVWLHGTQPMSLPESNCVCIPNFRSVAPRVCFTEVPHLLLFFPGTNTGRGVATWTYLKSSPGDNDSKYIWVRGYSYLGPSVFSMYHFWHF